MCLLGDHHGRELLALHPTNNTGKDEAVHNSLKRYGATAESFAEYVRKHGYVNVQDLITPVGNYTDLEYLWDSAQLVSKYLPGAVHYTIQSIPEMLEAVKKSLELDISNMVEFAHLVRCRSYPVALPSQTDLPAVNVVLCHGALK